MRQTVQQIQQRQDVIVEELSQIRVMRRGSVSEQRYGDRRKRKGGKGASGPYFLWQGYVDGKRFGQRVSAAEAEQIREDIEQRHRFEQLCVEYVRLGEALAQQLAQEPRMEAAAEGILKKKLTSPSSKTRK